jgi:hypothetical protein
MNRFWKFFAALTLGWLLLLGLNMAAFYAVLGVPTINSRWAATVWEKKKRLAQEAQGPRFLIVGGSSALFGIKARELEKVTGLRTINLGTHAGMGLYNVLRQARSVARPGDTLLLVLEYELYSSPKLGVDRAEQEELDYVLAHEPDVVRRLPLRQLCNVVMATPFKRLKVGIKNRLNPKRYTDEPDMGVYSVQHIDNWGDQDSERGPAKLRKGDLIPSFFGRGHFADQLGSLPDLEEFCRWAATNHIRVLATYPNLLDDPNYHTPEARAGIQIIEQSFARLGVPVIGHYEDALLPPEAFLDTRYHLTEAASVVRTQKLAEQLKVCLSNADPLRARAQSSRTQDSISR